MHRYVVGIAFTVGLAMIVGCATGVGQGVAKAKPSGKSVHAGRRASSAGTMVHVKAGSPVRHREMVSAITDEITVPTRSLGGEAAASPVSSPAPSPEPQASPVSSGAAIGSEYQIGPDDVLDFRSLDDPTLSGKVTVRYDGYISLPLIPDLKVAGKTRHEAEDMVRKAYSKIFKDPQISLNIRESRSKSFYVMGDVEKPSQYPYQRPLSLLDAINTAGGLRINQLSGNSFVGGQGQLTKALIIRHVHGERQITEYDLRHLSRPGPHPSDTPVLPGDIIYVPEGVNLVYVLGAVHSPGVFEVTEGMRLLQLVIRTGGPDFSTAKIKHVVLLRPVDANNTEVMIVDLAHILRTGQDILIKPGDVVYVPRKNLVRAQEFVGRFTGVLSPLMSLYNQAWSTYYTADQFHQLYGKKSTSGAVSTQNLLQQLQNLPTTVFNGLNSLGSLVKP